MGSYIPLAIVGVVVIWLVTGVRVINQAERGIVFRFGKTLPKVRRPGLTLLEPLADGLRQLLHAQEPVERD
ncbi:hypothetical protein Psi02_46460 [Planotetraspora silvatica]|uniref:Band 7 domain-containing protein n=1 Tax=Planotetraspora silvatica TaxID=234614 RepID=A0A8J3UR00_9ACTN|nr:hypothetical protein [Planotetraspora silvatica]GII48222.1 hypothetical protein Psi02_46460 [Planotetraspora silvatica]